MYVKRKEDKIFVFKNQITQRTTKQDEQECVE